MKSCLAKHRKVVAGFEKLEDRRLLAQFGVAWDDPMHLTMSFVPDKTSIADLRSDLHSELDTQMPRSVWQSAIFSAAQKWMDVTNVNLGLVTDHGNRFGSAGPTQGDDRFGDLRIGGYRMENSVMAISIPPGAASGTLAGDIFLNTAVRFSPTSLTATALHEIGHALGLGHSDDPNSVMFSHLNNRTSLSASDIDAIQALYGERSSDSNEIDGPNDSSKDATRIRYSEESGGYDGSTPLVEYGDISTIGDVDYFFLPGLSGYHGQLTFHIKTPEVSLLTTKVTVTNRDGVELARGSSSKDRTSSVQVSLPQHIPNERYYLRIEAAPGAVHKIGRYAIGVTFDDLLESTAISLNSVLKGNYESLAPEVVDQLFQDPNSIFLDDDLNSDDTFETAVDLRQGGGNSQVSLTVPGTLHNEKDVDVYRVRTPDTLESWVLTATVLEDDLNPVLPRISIQDSSGVILPSQVIANGNQTFSIQAVNLDSNRSYFVTVASPTQLTGNYQLHVSLGSTPVEFSNFVSGQIDSSLTPVFGKLYIARPQLFNFVLESQGLTGSVTMTLRNSAGLIVEQLTAQAQDISTGISRLLAPGEYSVSITSASPHQFTLRGSQLSDPLGPVIDSTLLNPVYVSPNKPGTYVYPGGHVSINDYYWLIFVLI